jgi:hypothetical protein
MIVEGQIEDAKTIVAVFRVLHRLRARAKIISTF